MSHRLASLILVLGLAFSTAGQAASSSKTFTLSNSGNGPMTISGAGISGNTAEFALTGNTCASVAQGASCALTVTFTPNGGDARLAAALNFNSNGTNGQVHSIALAGTGAPSQVTRVIAANASDVNMAALFGNPGAPGTYVLTINGGVYVTASSTAGAALSTGSFPAGSTVKIVNNGYVLGKGGAGGCGINSCGNTGTGTAGAAAGPALNLGVAVVLDNAGVIGGGGGGGGGGGKTSGKCAGTVGGGGGGGANAGAGGPGYTYGAAGGPLYGGAGGTTNAICALTGGVGGNLGAPGTAGADALYASGGGGAAGKAILTNGHSITWLSGNDATHLKGAVQ